MNYDDPYSDDNDIDPPKDTMNMKSSSSSSTKDDSELGLLLYELASLDVGSDNNNNSDQPQTCPICSIRVSLKEFADHVHGCLDNMDKNDRDDMRSQLERDGDFAAAYARQVCYISSLRPIDRNIFPYFSFFVLFV